LPDNGELFAGVALGHSLSSESGTRGRYEFQEHTQPEILVIKNASGSKVPTSIDIQSNYALAIDHIDGNWTNASVSNNGYGIHVKCSP